MSFITIGGNFMTDGMGNAASTQLVVTENPALSEAQMNQ